MHLKFIEGKLLITFEESEDKNKMQNYCDIDVPLEPAKS